MYTAYFGLNENPFSIAPDPLYLYMSEHHREALAHLKYGVKSDGGFVLLTGEVGAGKTTLCRSLLEQLPENVVVAYVLNPKVSVIELLETICDELHIERPEQGSIKQLVDRLNAFLLEANAQGRKTVLIIDEAQNLAIDVLEQLRLLTNLETNRYKLLQIVLLGQPELLQILNRQELRQLSQRVTARYHLGSLDVDELDAYIRHRLHIAGCQSPVFPATLAKTTWQLTGGIPRLINLVCDRALLGAYVLERQQVDKAILRQAAREVLGDLPPRRQNQTSLIFILIGCLLVLALGVAWYWKPSVPATPLQAAVTIAAPSAVAAADPTPVVTPQEMTGSELAAAAAAQASEDSDQQGAPLLQSWPMDFAVYQGAAEAFDDLARLWGLPPADRVDFCSYAEQMGLNCLQRRDGLETLRALNRPAILTLYNDDGEPFHAVINSLDDNSVTFIADGEQRELALAAITSRWFGDYLLLWEKPPFELDLLPPGRAGDAVGWLAETLQQLGLYAMTGREVRLEGALLGAFKRFQFSRGLTSDGILGPMSLIHLNTARNLPGPRLAPQGAR